jgi:hypothetical protein
MTSAALAGLASASALRSARMSSSSSGGISAAYAEGGRGRSSHIAGSSFTLRAG